MSVYLAYTSFHLINSELCLSSSKSLLFDYGTLEAIEALIVHRS